MNINFGKQSIIFVCLNSILLYSSFSFALSDEETYIVALQHAHNEFSIAVQALEYKTTECSKLNSISVLNIMPHLSTINESDLMLALAYLSFQNSETCVHEAKANIVYAMSSLNLLIKDLTKKGVNIKQYKSNMKIELFHTIIGGIEPRMAYLRARYKALSKVTRSKIESIKELQHTSFDPLYLSEKIIELRHASHR